MTIRLHKALSATARMVPALIMGLCLSAASPPSGGTIVISSRTANGDDATSLPLFENAAARALGTKGFTILDDPAHAAYVAEVTITRTEVGTARTKVPVGSPSYTGAGISIPFSIGQSRLVPLERTELAMRIRKRGDQTAVWHGAALTIRPEGSPYEAVETVAAALSEAALRIYPGEAAGIVGVP